MSSRPYTHRQDVDTGITAVITVEEDMRFLRSTLRSVLTQNVLPGVVIIADATGRTSSRITTSFEVIPSPSGPVMEVPQSKHVTIHIVSAKAHAPSAMRSAGHWIVPIWMTLPAHCGCSMMIPALRMTHALDDCLRRGAIRRAPVCSGANSAIGKAPICMMSVCMRVTTPCIPWWSMENPIRSSMTGGRMCLRCRWQARWCPCRNSRDCGASMPG